MSQTASADVSARWPNPVRVAHALVLILLASLAVAPGAAVAATTAPTFARTDYQGLGNNHVLADFNGDGKLDLAGIGAQSAAVLLGNGNGTFGARVEYPVFTWAQDLAAGDFTGDGKLDLVVTINDPQVSLSLLAGNGDGTFRAAVNSANTAGFDSPALAAVDLNNDGKLDVVIAHQIACFTAPCRVGRTISVMIGNGDGTFQPAREIDVGTGMSKIAVGDFNRDGRKDLAIAGDQSRVYRLFGLGDGTFVAQPTLTLTADTFGVDATDIDVADFNGDTLADLVVAIALNGSRTAILIGNGDGTFRAPVIITEPNGNVPQYQAVADYNGDGFPDLALSLGNGNQGLLEILNGNGNGTFQPPVYFLVPAPKSSISGYAIVAANLNSDTKPDIVLGISGASPALAVLVNTTGGVPPPPPPTPTLSAIALSPTSVVGGNSSQGTATLTSAAPSGGAVVTLSSSNTAATVPASVTVAAGATSATFTVSTVSVTASTAAMITATFGGLTRSATLTVAPPSAPAALSAVSVNPANVAGGTPAQGTITLTSGAPAGGFAVSLSSSNTAAATVPASVSVSQGATSATFAIPTSAVATSTPVTITASAGGVIRTADLTVTPPGQTATLTVTASGRSGERVISSPAGINVTVGSSGSAPFGTATAITLSATNSRDVVWSGACSSGGNKVKTCTFTLSANASVTANVQ